MLLRPDVCEAFEVLTNRAKFDKIAPQAPEPEEVKLQRLADPLNLLAWRRRWWLTILTLYVYVIAPHTGWIGNMPVPIITLNYVLRFMQLGHCPGVVLVDEASIFTARAMAAVKPRHNT